MKKPGQKNSFFFEQDEKPQRNLLTEIEN